MAPFLLNSFFIPLVFRMQEATNPKSEEKLNALSQSASLKQQK